MINSFGHQTIEKTSESITDRTKKGPVKSLMVTRSGKLRKQPPFAGEGFYFWEDNIDAAEWWGDVHYKKYGNEYRIFRIDLSFKYDDNTFLDLIGNRQHLRFIEKLINKTKKNIDCNGWKLHNYVNYFRLQESKHNGMFPYKMIRFNDCQLNPRIQNQLQLNDYQSVSLMNPFYIVCVFELEILELDTFIFIK